jgi:hypothetical protein
MHAFGADINLNSKEYPLTIKTFDIPCFPNYISTQKEHFLIKAAMKMISKATCNCQPMFTAS